MTSGRSVIEASSTRSKASSPPQAGQAGSGTGTSTGGSESCSGAGASRRLNIPRPGLRPGRLGSLTRVPLENGAAGRLPERVNSSTFASSVAIAAACFSSKAACLRMMATSSSRPRLARPASVMAAI